MLSIMSGSSQEMSYITDGSIVPNQHIYQTLAWRNSTRVLTLWGSSDAEAYGGPLRCDLEEVRLDGTHKEYVALSYVWAQKTSLCTPELSQPHNAESSVREPCVWFGNQSLRIHDNLFWALVHLRRRGLATHLWVDALCINQQDLDERSRQVQFMREIYQRASETIIWLGPEAGAARALWNFDRERYPFTLNNDVEERQRVDLGSFGKRFWHIQVDVLSRPWFRRLWVVQELVVSRRPFVQCGHRRISWNDFCETVFFYPRIYDSVSVGNLQEYNNLNNVRDLHLARSSYLRSHNLSHFLPSWALPEELQHKSKSSWSIIKLLARARYLEASDARDKIYGLLGIASGADTDLDYKGFDVSYRGSTDNVYSAFTRHILETTRSFDILSYVDPAAEAILSQAMPLPSWVPNWDYQDLVSYGSNQTILESLPEESTDEKKLRQARVTRSQIPWDYQRWGWDNRKILSVRGRIIGQLEETTMPLRLVGKEELDFQWRRDDANTEGEKVHSVMRLWRERLLFDRLIHPGVPHCDPLNYAEQYTTVKSPNRSKYRVVRSPRREDRFSSHFSDSRVHTANSVEQHLYSRARKTADWPEAEVIVDKESVVDGKRLAICITAEPPFEQLALVPAWAEKGDLVVQISGCRVPFVMMPFSAGWPEEIVNMSWMFEGTRTISLVACRLVGECVLNEFKEMDETMTNTLICIN